MWCSITAAQPGQRTSKQRWLRTRPYIAEIVVTGNTAVDDGEVRDWMEISTAGFWAPLGLTGRPRYNRATARRDENSIGWHYGRLGYWDASASITAEPERDDDHARVIVTIIEGTQYHWGTIELVADSLDFLRRLQRRVAKLEHGHPADSIEFELAKANILGECANNRYPGARLSAIVAARSDTLDVVFELDEGPYVVLGETRVDGLKHTKERIVHRVLRLESGTEYSRELLDERRQDVYATGLFSLVRLDPAFRDSVDSDSVRRADVQLRLIERPPSFIGFRTGAGQDENRDLTWDYAVEWGSRNWLGTARRYTLSAQSSFAVVTEWRFIHHRFSAQYVEPFPFGLRLPTTLEISFEPRLRSLVQDYKVEKVSGVLSVARRDRRKRLQWVASAEIDRVDISDVPKLAEEEILREEGISLRRRITFALERDTRPNLFVPSSGARTRVDLGFTGGPLGGRDDYYSVDLSWSRYQAVGQASVFASRFRLGWKNVHSGGPSIPSIDRFYLGGANSIRGYSENSVGPTDSTGSAVGGRVVTLMNLELRTQIAGNWWTTLFGDAGNNWESFRAAQFDRMLFSLGVGLQYVAPVGPIRLDYARRVIHPGHPQSDRVHLSILFAF
ncbi:MAG: BamA/TamA family outer membrane protein [candidate division Zixibacteria bacterium]|nr:BamA/TamA family outer membrane protein [candidate division Zixibacteria bacterium]